MIGTIGHRSGVWGAGTAALVIALGASGASGDEVTVKNDSITDGSSATICPCFAPGEHVAVWLESPCNGTIVAIQVFWRSPLASEPDMIEDSILIRNPGTYPTPGSVLQTLDAPVLTDGVLNEYRYLDQNQTIPIEVPVTSGQEFVIDFIFFNDNQNDPPSLVFDSDGATTGKNAIFSGFWFTNQQLGVTGDWMIRAVIDCDETGACCFADVTCQEDLTQTDCETMSGVYLGGGTTCAGDPCVALDGACCTMVGGCVLQNQDDCVNQIGGTWQGPGTTCPDACVSPCVGDIDGDGDTDVFDFGDLAAAFGSVLGDAEYNPDADLDHDNDVDVFDFGMFGPDFGCGL